MTGKGKYLYDTDVIIDYLKGESEARALLEEETGMQCISVVTVAELYAGARDMKECEVIKGLAEYFEVIDINQEIAKEGGLYKQKYHKSHNVALPDGLIGATAICLGLELKTLNIKHYPMIKYLKAAYRKGS
jgi:predicted nucleic acid-binding protein